MKRQRAKARRAAHFPQPSLFEEKKLMPEWKKSDSPFERKTVLKRITLPDVSRLFRFALRLQFSLAVLLTALKKQCSANKTTKRWYDGHGSRRIKMK
jgi:hypothetical protein